MLKMKVSINLGNEAMQTGPHVAEALQQIGEDLWDRSYYNPDYTPTLGRIVNQTIFDRNGNDVGRWSIDDD